jgi:hypothetical protein
VCQFISFFHRPDNGDISVKILDDHSGTKEKLNLDENLWREGHYLPDGTIECRVIDTDRVTEKDCNERMKGRFPTFISFANWCFGKNSTFTGLDLSGLTSAAGLKLPSRIGGGLDLRGLTSEERKIVMEEYEEARTK